MQHLGRAIAYWFAVLGIASVVLSSVWLGGVEAADLDEQMAELGIMRFDGDIDAPDFTLRTPDGAQVRLSDFRGQVVLLNFWATW